MAVAIVLIVFGWAYYFSHTDDLDSQPRHGCTQAQVDDGVCHRVDVGSGTPQATHTETPAQ